MALSAEEKNFLDQNFKMARDAFFESRKTVLNALFFVTTGTFVLSVSFLSFLSNTPLMHGELLEFSWICMALSVMSYIGFAHHDAEAEGAVMDDIRQQMSKDTLPIGYTPGATGKAQRFYKRANAFLYTTYVLAGFGILAFLIFGIANFAAKQSNKNGFTQEYDTYLYAQGWR